MLPTMPFASPLIVVYCNWELANASSLQYCSSTLVCLALELTHLFLLIPRSLINTIMLSSHRCLTVQAELVAVHSLYLHCILELDVQLLGIMFIHYVWECLKKKVLNTILSGQATSIYGRTSEQNTAANKNTAKNSDQKPYAHHK